MISFNAPEKPYKGYIFDCDGTLADSMPLHLRAWNAGLVAAQAPFHLDGKNFMSVAGMALRETVEHWNETHTLQIDPDVVIEAKNAYFEQHRHAIGPIEPVVDFARACHAAGAAVSVASGGTTDDVLFTLRNIGLGELFEVVVTADDVENAKPAPDLFLLAAKKMGVAPSDCLVLEDSLLGIEGAEKAGMESILIPHPF
ncbi:MAG: HAD family hydrolase [Puniceicoccaceae bacterium]